MVIGFNIRRIPEGYSLMDSVKNRRVRAGFSGRNITVRDRTSIIVHLQQKIDLIFKIKVRNKDIIISFPSILTPPTDLFFFFLRCNQYFIGIRERLRRCYLGWRLGPCTWECNHPVFAASPTWWERTSQQGSHKRPHRRGRWELKGKKECYNMFWIKAMVMQFLFLF